MNYTRNDDGVIDVLAERVEGLCADMSEMKHGIAKMADAGGPMNTSPAAAQALAKSSFSLKKP